MTLKDIYTWIEDHFPYFKHVAKPGWKVTSRPSSSSWPQGETIISLAAENEKLFPSLQNEIEINLKPHPKYLLLSNVPYLNFFILFLIPLRQGGGMFDH